MKQKFNFTLAAFKMVTTLHYIVPDTRVYQISLCGVYTVSKPRSFHPRYMNKGRV